MFSRRDLSAEVAAVRSTHAPDTPVLDVATDADTLDPAAAEDLGLFVDALDPATHPTEWLPDDAPTLLRRYAGSDFTVGMPGDGTVFFTRQTRPPTVLVKERADGTPDAFLDFLLAEAFVRIGAGVPEHFLPFFGAQYRALDAGVDLSPADGYQMAAALFDGWVNRQTRETFRGWEDTRPGLYAAWVDAGDRLRDRVEALPGAVARGETSFPEATELACAAMKHDLSLPTPFTALDTAAYDEYGAEYAVKWAEKTLAALGE